MPRTRRETVVAFSEPRGRRVSSGRDMAVLQKDMGRCVVTEKERNLDPFAKAVHAAPTTMDQFMSVGIADLTKEKPGSNEEADLCGDDIGLVCKCIDHKK